MVESADIIFPYHLASPEWIVACDVQGREVLRGRTLGCVVDRLRLRVAPEDVIILAHYPSGSVAVPSEAYSDPSGEWLAEEDIREPEVFGTRFERSHE